MNKCARSCKFLSHYFSDFIVQTPTVHSSRKSICSYLIFESLFCARNQQQHFLSRPSVFSKEVLGKGCLCIHRAVFYAVGILKWTHIVYAFGKKAFFIFFVIVSNEIAKQEETWFTTFLAGNGICCMVWYFPTTLLFDTHNTWFSEN